MVFREKLLFEPAIVNWIDYQISNGILEGFNSIFQATKTKAKGYKKTETIKTIIDIFTGKLDFSNVNHYYITKVSHV